MRKILLLLATIALCWTATLTAARAMPACTCNSERAACGQYCRDIGCQRSHFICNTSDPCNSTCYCTFCIP